MMHFVSHSAQYLSVPPSATISVSRSLSFFHPLTLFLSPLSSLPPLLTLLTPPTPLIPHRTKARHPCLDPIILVAKLDLRVGLGHQGGAEDGGFFGRDFDPRHEVGGVAGGGEGAGAGENLVHGTPVDAGLWGVGGCGSVGVWVDGWVGV